MQLPISAGQTGKAVQALSTLLQAAGYLDAPQSSFDRDMSLAVRAFQTQHVDERGQPLVIDGVVGPLTWWALTHPKQNPVPDPDLHDFSNQLPRGGSNRGRAALREALDEMSAGAGESGSNNQGPDVRKYLNGIVDPPADWCAGFVSWCFDQHAAGCPFGYTLGARDLYRRCRDRGWAYDIRQQRAEPGDIVAWTRPGPKGWEGHVGIVLMQTEGGYLHTIEGNRGAYPAKVNRFSYVVSRMERLLGFARVSP